jgi:hypothetical protein
MPIKCFIDDLPIKLALFKRHLFAAPFHKAIEKKPAEIITFAYRPEENVYIKSDPDRVTIIFDILFRDADDIVFSKVFLQVLTLKSFFFPVF